MEDPRVLNQRRWLTEAAIGALAGFLLTAGFWAFEASGLSLLSPWVWKQFSSLWAFVTLPTEALVELSGHPITTYDEGAFSTRMVLPAVLINSLLGGALGLALSLVLRRLRFRTQEGQPPSGRQFFTSLAWGSLVGGGLTAVSVASLFVFPASSLCATLSASVFLLLSLPYHLLTVALQMPKPTDLTLGMLVGPVVVNGGLAGLLWAAFKIRRLHNPN